MADTLRSRADSLRRMVNWGVEQGKKNIVADMDVLQALFLAADSEGREIDPMGDLVSANRDVILKRHEEAIARLRKALEAAKQHGWVQDHIEMGLAIINALSLYHPMNDTWPGWPEGS